METQLTAYDLDRLNAQRVCVDLPNGVLLVARSIEALEPEDHGGRGTAGIVELCTDSYWVNVRE